MDTKDSIKAKLWPVNHVARILHIHPSSVYRKFNEGKLMGIRLSERKLMIFESSVYEHVEELNEE